jgi:hypothetical protein
MQKDIMEGAAKWIGKYTRQIVNIDPSAGKLKYCPDAVIWLSFWVSLSSLAQAFADFMLEFLSLAGFILKIPFRVEFLMLTIIAAMLGRFALTGLRQREIDISKNSILLGIVVESSLIVSDIYFIFFDEASTQALDLIRTPFLLLTALNVLILIYISLRVRLFGFGFQIPTRKPA